MLSLPIIDKFLWSVVVLGVSPDSDSVEVLIRWFCDNSPQSVYKLRMGRYEKYVHREVASAKLYQIRDSAF